MNALVPECLEINGTFSFNYDNTLLTPPNFHFKIALSDTLLNDIPVNLKIDPIELKEMPWEPKSDITVVVLPI